MSEAVAMQPKRGLTKVSMACYGLGELASQFVWTYMGTYLSIFFTDIVGLTPAIVSAILLWSRVWDAVNDPMMGALAERGHTKWGRFRPYIAIGAPLLALLCILTFTIPFDNDRGKVIWATVIYILCGMVYTVVMIPYSALATVMTTDGNERNIINTWRGFGMSIGMLAVNMCAPFVMLMLSNGGDEPTAPGYLWTMVILGIISVPLYLTVAKQCKEVVQVDYRGKKIPLRDTIKNCAKNRNLMVVSLSQLVMMGAYMGRISITAYYVIYCLGSFTLIAAIMSIPSVCNLVMYPFVPKLTRRFGKRNLLVASQSICGLMLVIVYFIPFDNIGGIIAAHVGFGLTFFSFPVILSMFADAIDYQELKTGVRSDGTASAIQSLSTKLGNAIGGSVGVLLLGKFGYVPGAQQSVETMNGINLCTNLIPGILIIASALLVLFWNLSDQDAEGIRAQLNAKRGESA